MECPYRTVAPVDLHPHGLGEELPSSVQLRLVQLPPGRLELLIPEAERHRHAAAEPRTVSGTAPTRTTLPVATVKIKAPRSSLAAVGSPLNATDTDKTNVRLNFCVVIFKKYKENLEKNWL